MSGPGPAGRSAGGPVGFVGIGNMGRRMAANLAAAGFALIVRDSDAGAQERFVTGHGGEAAASPQSFAEAGVVVTMLPDSNAVREAMLGWEGGIAAALKPGAVLLDMSSSDPVGTQALARDLAPAGIRVIDAPVSGGITRAEAGTLSLMVGGQDEDAFAQVRPVLETLGERIFWTGPLGSGHAMKALNNFLGASAYTTAAEALAIGKEFGLDPAVMLDVVNSSTGRSFNTEVVLKQDVITGRYGTGFALGLLAKDVGIAAGLADAVGVDAPACHLVRDRWAQAAAALGFAADHSEAHKQWWPIDLAAGSPEAGSPETDLAANRLTQGWRAQLAPGDWPLCFIYDYDRVISGCGSKGQESAMLTFAQATGALDQLIDRDQDFRLLGTGYGFTEGPAWNTAGGYLVFSDIPGDRRWRWSEQRGMELDAWPTYKGNGMAYEPDGSLLVCEQVTSSLIRIRPDGLRQVVACHYQGKYLNSPNDVIVRSDGSIYFTDPNYGRWDVPVGVGRKCELDYQGVYRVPPGGGDTELVVAEKEFEQPNGLAFSPDESILYVNDRRNLKAYDVAPDGSLSNVRMVHDDMGSPGTPGNGNPDGMEVDALGNIWCTARGGIWVMAPDGGLLGIIETPEVSGSLVWGGADMRSLFVCTSTTMHLIRTKVGPAPLPF